MREFRLDVARRSPIAASRSGRAARADAKDDTTARRARDER